jgi:hypothetical protein
MGMKTAFVVLGTVSLLVACAVPVEPGEIPPAASDGGTGDGGGCTTMCNGACANLKTDNANCGRCGNACPDGASCVQGSCQCASGTLCNGACVDTKTDVMNCGKCGTACGGGDAGAPKGGGTWICSNGVCDIQCSAPKSACVPTGCFDLQSDNTNCGTCGNDCGGNLCIAGNCCGAGEINCNMACTNTQTDPNNCGKCGNKCASNTCTMGQCCSKPPTGNCAHNPCTSGVKLATSCDNGACVSKVCAMDPYCCNSSWDSLCVSEVDQYCGPLYKCSC